MEGNKAVVGVFHYLDDLLHAIDKAKAESRDYRVYSPVPRHEIEEVTYPQRSSVRRFTMAGAMTGITFGFGLAIMCSMDYPMRVSAKDIISIPGFVVVGYECTILFGALATLLGMIIFCRLPDLLRKVGYDPRFSLDKFGIVIGCQSDEVDGIKQTLTRCGADEVQVKEAI